ncbi:MAG: hypothetical protein RJA22_2995 [Verrucomicrobiota bacterium]|jgi:hypothetical protein
MKVIKPLLPVLLLAAAAMLGSAPLDAADRVEKVPPATERKLGRPPFGGKLAAVDKAAGTIKIGERTFHVTPATKIHMGGKPATLDDAKVGDEVGGQYRQGEGGRLELLSLRVGPKPEKKADSAK